MYIYVYIYSVDKERELLKNELTKIKKQVQASEGIIENQVVELLKLNRIIEEVYVCVCMHVYMIYMCMHVRVYDKYIC